MFGEMKQGFCVIELCSGEEQSWNFCVESEHVIQFELIGLGRECIKKKYSVANTEIDHASRSFVSCGCAILSLIR